MPLTIGTIQTFPNVRADKSQIVKIIEEASEVLNEWKQLCGAQSKIVTCIECTYKCGTFDNCISEIADTIQACANLASALGVDDMRDAMSACEERNRARGRL